MKRKVKALSALISLMMVMSVLLMNVSNVVCAEKCEGCTQGTFNGKLACLTNGELHLCECNFPDKLFRDHIQCYFDYRKGITEEDAAKRLVFHMRGSGIQSLQGIGFFPGLACLYCDNNRFTHIDLSGCTSLNTLYCYNNKYLTSLRLQGCTSLEYLWCSNCSFSEMHLQGCVALKYIDCSHNKLTALDLSECVKMESCTCDCNQISVMNLNKCKDLISLQCINNEIGELDLQNCSHIYFLRCRGNQITSIKLSIREGKLDFFCLDNSLPRELVTNTYIDELIGVGR